MKTLIEGLMNLGWIGKNPLPEFEGDTVKPYWQWLVDNPGDYLSFSPHDAYSADWDEKNEAGNQHPVGAEIEKTALST